MAALGACEATYVDGGLRERLPSDRGEALVVDDCTESVQDDVVRVRERETEHEGGSPRASTMAAANGRNEPKATSDGDGFGQA